jgi:hypothetical protein
MIETKPILVVVKHAATKKFDRHKLSDGKFSIVARLTTEIF